MAGNHPSTCVALRGRRIRERYLQCASKQASRHGHCCPRRREPGWYRILSWITVEGHLGSLLNTSRTSLVIHNQGGSADQSETIWQRRGLEAVCTARIAVTEIPPSFSAPATACFTNAIHAASGFIRHWRTWRAGACREDAKVETPSSNNRKPTFYRFISLFIVSYLAHPRSDC
ncbi:hypothetical protein BC835DRAFT_570703 [Cytidiella melzeri]|nr:hypothetical protein BC835DRAFT_570703 [Cytidiella melzeri]